MLSTSKDILKFADVFHMSVRKTESFNMKKMGSALVEYILPIAIIGILVGWGLYALSQNNVILNFFASSNNSTINKSAGSIVIGNISDNTLNISAGGQYGGSKATPVEKCVAGKCTIDFGDYYLKNIPEDFSDFISTAGSAGASHELSSIMEQLATQLEIEGEAAAAEEFRKLANLGHFTANMQKQIEADANFCSSDPDPGACFIDKIKNTKTITIPSEVSSLLPDTNFTGQIDYFTLQRTSSVGFARMMKNTNPTYYENNKNKFPGFKMLEYLDNLQSSSASTPIKNTAIALIQQLSDVSSIMDKGVQAFFYNTYGGTSVDGYNYNYYNDNSDLVYDDFNMYYSNDYADFYHTSPTSGTAGYDVMTGSRIFLDVSAPDFPTVSSIKNPKSSQNSDVKSVLMCVAGKDIDTGHECNNY